jgi:acyl dehydratase
MSPVPVGANLRLGVKLLGVDDITGGVQYAYELTFECEGAAKPSCVAEVIYRAYE